MVLLIGLVVGVAILAVLGLELLAHFRRLRLAITTMQSDLVPGVRELLAMLAAARSAESPHKTARSAAANHTRVHR